MTQLLPTPHSHPPLQVYGLPIPQGRSVAPHLWVCIQVPFVSVKQVLGPSGRVGWSSSPSASTGGLQVTLGQ